MTADFQDWARSRQVRIENSLQTLLPAANVAPERLHDAMRYTVLGGGKRVRPLLEQWTRDLDRLRDHLGDLDNLFLELDLPSRDA